MGFGNRLEFVHNGTAFTQTGAINMGTNNITNCGNITADNADGFQLTNSAASDSVPTIVPRRSVSTYGIGGTATTVSGIISGAEKMQLSTSQFRLLSGVALAPRGGINNDAATTVSFSADDISMVGSDADLGAATVKILSNAVSSGALSGGTATLSSLIPAGAVVLGTCARVTTTITGCTSFQIGDGTDVDRFGNAIALTSGTTTTNANWTISTVPSYAAATDIVLTAVGGGASFTGGVVRMVIYYAATTAPTS